MSDIRCTEKNHENVRFHRRLSVGEGALVLTRCWAVSERLLGWAPRSAQDRQTR